MLKRTGLLAVPTLSVCAILALQSAGHGIHPSGPVAGPDDGNDLWRPFVDPVLLAGPNDGNDVRGGSNDSSDGGGNGGNDAAGAMIC